MSALFTKKKRSPLNILAAGSPTFVAREPEKAKKLRSSDDPAIVGGRSDLVRPPKAVHRAGCGSAGPQQRRRGSAAARSLDVEDALS
jgi:hypothetical protein